MSQRWSGARTGGAREAEATKAVKAAAKAAAKGGGRQQHEQEGGHCRRGSSSTSGPSTLQAAGCALLARSPMSVDAPTGTTEAVLTSQLLGAALSAVLRHPVSPLVQLHGAHAMLNTARGGDALATALLKGEGGALLAAAAMLQQQRCCSSLRQCAALGSLARLGPKAVAALVHKGAAAALISAAVSSQRGAQWRARCASVVFGLCEATDAMVLRALLAAGLVPTLVALCAADDADERTRVRATNAIGALPWRGSSSVLRQQVKQALRVRRARSCRLAARTRGASLCAWGACCS